MRILIPVTTILLMVVPLCAATPVRVAIIGAGDEKKAGDVVSLAAAQLSGQTGVELVERSAVDLIFRELKTGAVFGNKDQRARMGQLLGADYFVWLTMPGGTLEIADAQSGESVEKKQLDVQSAQGMAEAICAEVKVLKAPAAVGPNAVAFTISREPDGNPANEVLLAAVMKQLQGDGVPVLHRRYIDTVIAEHLWQEKGIVGSEGGIRPLLGAQFLVGARFEKSSLEIGVLDVKSGMRIAQHSWAANEAAPIAEWLEGIFKNPPRVATQEKAKKEDGDTVQPETLAPLYDAILLHNQGRYFEASDLLLGAYESDNRLLPAIRWLQSSYRLGGFEEISASIDNFLKTARENPRSLTDAINHPKSINGAAGVALLGLTMDAHSPGDLKGPLTMALIDALHAATDQPVLLCEDIAQLRAEYDVLTGLENVQGTTWREAPALLLARSITAHLESGKDGGWQLRLCAIRELDPGRIEDQVVNLPNESADWKIKITDALRKLLGEDTGLAAAWKPPAAVIAENEEKLSIALKSQYDDPTLLKLLHVNPDQFDLLWKFPKNRSGVSPLANALRAGMQDWIWMHLPKTSIQRPWIDLQFIEARHGQKLDEFIPLLREFVNKNQRNPAGAVAKFNLLLYDLNEDNIASTEKGIDEVLPVFRHMPEKQFTPQRIQMVEQMRDLLRCAMGQPVANALDLKPCGTIHHPQVFLPDPWLAPMPQHLTVIKKMKDWFEDDSLQAERCKVDVAFYHSVLHREEIPVGLMKQIIEEHAKEPALLTYIMVGYGHDFFDRKEFQQGEIADAATIYSRFVDAITGILSIKLEGPDFKASLRAGFDVALIIDLRASTQELLRNQPVFREARARLSRAIVQAIINERFRDWGNGGNCMLLLDRSGAFSDPECDRFLRERAEQSWKTDPTRDSFWSDYMGWHWRSFAPGERTAEFLKHLPELEALRAKNPWSLRMTELYFQFAEGFYTDSKYEQAKDVLEAIAASKSETVTIPEPEIRAHAFYLLSMLRQRDGDTPGALRIAQAALDEMRDDKFREAGLPLKSEITGYIGKLRADPNLPFKNPYAAAATPVPEKTPATTPGQPTTTP